MSALPWLIMGLLLVGRLSLAHRIRAGWLCSMVADSMFFWYAFATRQWGFAVGAPVFFMVHSYGYYQWKETDAKPPVDAFVEGGGGCEGVPLSS